MAGGETYTFVDDLSKYLNIGNAETFGFPNIEYGFKELNLNLITLRVKKANVTAYHLYKSLGFREVKSDDEWITMQIGKE
jgi:hypothetical protein